MEQRDIDFYKDHGKWCSERYFYYLDKDIDIAKIFHDSLKLIWGILNGYNGSSVEDKGKKGPISWS